MPLNKRQQRLYVHTFSIYRQARNDAGDMVYTLLTSGVKGYLFSTTNVDEPMAVGLAKKDLAMTMDKIHFTAETDVQSQDVIKHTTTGHRDNGTWYKVLGEPMIRESTARRRPNLCQVFVNKTTQPAMAA